MAKNKNSQPSYGHLRQNDAPKDLTDHPFYGLHLDEEQRDFRDAIWSKDYDIVFCNARSGSGKTTIAVATALLLCQYNLYSGIIYQSAAGVHEYKQGLLPGSLEQKNLPLFAPLYQAVARLDYDPMRLIASELNPMYQKDGSAIITAQSDSYIRGTSMGEVDAPVVVILDEAQNYTVPALRTALTRINAGSKAIVIGHDKQCDLKYPQDSGFAKCISLFSTVDWCKVCKLTTNYRGRISALADEL